MTTIAMDRLDTPEFDIKAAARIRASPNFVCTIVSSAVVIVLAQFAHTIGLLYSEAMLMENIGLSHTPTIYLEAIPTYLMVLFTLLPFLVYTKWKRYLIGLKPEEDADMKPILIILMFVHSVALSLLTYAVQILVIIVQVYRRHLDRLPVGDRCSCFVDDLKYLFKTLSVAKAHQCLCFLPSFPHHKRSIQLVTDDLGRLVPTTLEQYAGVTAEHHISSIKVTQYVSDVAYRDAYAKERFSEPYVLMIILIMCNLLMLALRLVLWIKVKELWTESEKMYMAKQITDSAQDLKDRGKLSFRTRIKHACQVAKMLQRIDKTYEEMKRSNIKIMIDEFTFAFLEGADAIALFLDILEYAYSDPTSDLLVPAMFFICLGMLLVNIDNALLSIPGQGERITNYVRSCSSILINFPFFVIRVFLFIDEGRTGLPFLLLILFLMKEIISFILSLIDTIQMVRRDCKNRATTNKVVTAPPPRSVDD